MLAGSVLELKILGQQQLKFSRYYNSVCLIYNTKSSQNYCSKMLLICQQSSNHLFTYNRLIMKIRVLQKSGEWKKVQKLLKKCLDFFDKHLIAQKYSKIYHNEYIILIKNLVSCYIRLKKQKKALHYLYLLKIHKIGLSIRSSKICSASQHTRLQLIHYTNFSRELNISKNPKDFKNNFQDQIILITAQLQITQGFIIQHMGSSKKQQSCLKNVQSFTKKRLGREVEGSGQRLRQA